METISVIGAGAWGTAIAQALASAGKNITLWAREDEVVDSINTKHENTMFFPGVALDEKIKATSSISDARQSDLLIMVTPAQALRDACVSLRHEDMKDKTMLICSKGFEIGTGMLLSDVAKQELPNTRIAVMTGPTFASDIGAGLPAAMTIAAETKDIADELRNFIGTKGLRPYATDDMVGTQIGGAAKNVIAIAAGVVMGKGLGESARAALITRGVAELARLTSAMGGRKETLIDMCGMGDLILTCTSMQSRNYSFGFMLGQGKDINEILEERNAVTEGYYSSKALVTLAKNQAVDMPIAEIVYRCLHDGLSIDAAIEAMLSRPFN